METSGRPQVNTSLQTCKRFGGAPRNRKRQPATETAYFRRAPGRLLGLFENLRQQVLKGSPVKPSAMLLTFVNFDLA